MKCLKQNPIFDSACLSARNIFLLLQHLDDAGDFLFAYSRKQAVVCQMILVDFTAVKTPCQIKLEFGTVIMQIVSWFIFKVQLSFKHSINIHVLDSYHH